MRTVDVLIGLPGAGKTTLAQRMAEEGRITNNPVNIISGDALREMMHGKYLYLDGCERRLYYTAMNMAQYLLKDGLDLVIDEATWVLTRSGRMRLIHHLRKAIPDGEAWGRGRVLVNAHIFPYNPQMLQRRQAEARGYSEQHWMLVVSNMVRVFEPVTASEGFDLIRYIGDDLS